MMVQKLTAIGTIAMALLMTLSTSADAKPIHEIRGQVAVIRGHSIGLREFLKAKCHVLPNLHSAQAMADRLACRANDLWDIVRRDCHLSPAEIDAQLCALEQQYRVTNNAVRAAAAFAPRHHLHHACFLLDRIDHHLCKARSIVRAWAPILAPPVQPVVALRPHWNPGHTPFRPHVEPHVRPHVRPHIDPHVRPHVDPHHHPHVAPHVNVHRPHIERVNRHQGRHGKLHVRIGGLTLCF